MEDDRNCCRIQHTISSIIICVIVFSVSLTLFIMACAYPDGIDIIYQVGGTHTKITAITTVCTGIMIIGNCLLAYGISEDWPLFILIWMIFSLILWKLHFVLFLCSLSFGFLQKAHCETTCIIRLALLFCFQVVWLALIIMIARHWYYLCEIIYTQEYGERPERFSRRLASTRSRIGRQSNIQRMPTVMHRLERN